MDFNQSKRGVSLSKSLSYVLRHGGPKEGLSIQSDGYALIDDVLALKLFKKWKYTYDEVIEVVDNNDKKRYAVKEIDGKMFIRANQGHTIEVQDLDLKNCGESFTNSSCYSWNLFESLERD